MPKRKPVDHILSRPVLIHICKDGTISYRRHGEPVLNGVAIPVFSVNTVEEAKEIQVRFGRRQYTPHPGNGMDWYRISVLQDGTDPAFRDPPVLETSDLDGITEMFSNFYWKFHGQK